jgi:hypothetical protein
VKQTTNYNPRIAFEAKKHKHDSAYRIWLVLRSMDTFCHGVGRDELQAKLGPIMGRLSFNTYVERMNGIFWRIDNKNRKLHHISAEKIAKHYGMVNIGRAVAEIDVDTILGSSLPMFRAIVFYHWFGCCIRGDRQISQTEIRRLTGISQSSQKNYRKFLKRFGLVLETKHNFEPITEVSASDLTEARYIVKDVQEATGRTPAIITDSLGEYGKAGVLYLAFRLPNSYIAKGYTPVYSGRSLFINRILRTNTVVTLKRGVGPSDDKQEREARGLDKPKLKPIKNHSSRHDCIHFLPNGREFSTGATV